MNAQEQLVADVADEIVMIATTELEGHPQALAFWGEGAARAEAAAGIEVSVAADGVKMPLTVTPQPGGGWWVVDGCTRLAAARSAGLSAVPCRVIEAGAEEIADEIYIANLVRTTFGSGMRVMRYLERHQAMVLQAAQNNADMAARGAQGGRGNKATVTDCCFTAKAIAGRLKASDKDVLAGIELLRCRVEGKTVQLNRRLRTRTLVPATEEEAAGVEVAYRRVLEGTPLRRWLPAAQGSAATADKARAETNYSALSTRAMVSLRTAWTHWDEMSEPQQDAFVKIWKTLLVNLPPEVMLATRKLLPPL